MTGHTRSVDPATLFEQYDWVLALARKLIGADEAEDVAQETMLTAMRTPPRSRNADPIPTGAMRAWLAKVASNLATTRFRKASTRRRHESVSAEHSHVPVVPSPAELAESSETLQALMTELGSLDSDLREPLTLRYMQGLSSHEIGEALSIPAGTVRGRIKRGLEVLRGKLDTRHDGNRQTWAGALATTLGIPASQVGTATVVTTAASTTTSAQTMIAGGVVIALVAAGSWFVIRSPDSQSPNGGEPGTIAAGPDRPDALRRADGDPAQPQDELAVQRDEVQVAIAPPETPQDAAVSLSAHEAGVLVRIVDADQNPLRATIEWTGGPNAFGISEDDGRASFAFSLPTTDALVTLRVRSSGYATRLLSGTARTSKWLDLGRIELPKSRTLRGRVLSPEGRPVAGAAVFATPGNGPAPSRQLRQLGPEPWSAFEMRPAHTDDAGNFSLYGVPTGSVQLWAVTADSQFCAVEIGLEHDQKPVELKQHPLSETQDIRGTVRGPTGEPLAGVQIRVMTTSPKKRHSVLSTARTVTSDAGGRFHVSARLGAVYELLIFDEEGRYEDLRITGVSAAAELAPRMF